MKNALLRRDPLGKGYDNPFGLDLLARLLSWDPMKRISTKEALLHAFFVGKHFCGYIIVL